jgi:hypothetical protein
MALDRVDSATGRDLAMLERGSVTVEIGSQWTMTHSGSSARYVRIVPMPGTCSTGAGKAVPVLGAAKLDKVRLAPMHGVVITARDGLRARLT